MTQRNPMNERYQDENRGGKTRKSSASAKPKAARAATVRNPAPKSKKQKKAEAREREREAMKKADALQSRFEDTDGYKRLRRIWWAALIGAIVCTGASFLIQANFGESTQGLTIGFMVVAYVLIIVAFYIDLGKIRKERKLYNASILNSKSKEARKEQKKLRAEQRAQEKEAAEKFEAAKTEEAAKKEQGLLARFRKKQPESSEPVEASETK